MDVSHLSLLHTFANSADYPSYELYTQTLRDGIFNEKVHANASPRQLWLVINKNRKVVKCTTIS